MEIKTVYMIHPFVYNEETLIRYLGINQNGFRFMWDDNNPDYLIATEHIYYHLSAWERFIELYPKAKIRIFHAGECISPDFNIFDYAISFDKGLVYGDRFIRMPPRLFFRGIIIQESNPWEGKENEAIDSLKSGKRFCNFVYSNSTGHEMREKLFWQISGYKRVDSLGAFLNNTGLNDKVEGESLTNLIRRSIETKSNYKFSIACENATFGGYTSEKIFTSLQAHTVPIYWGNPFIGEEVNPDCFINCHECDCMDDIIERIMEVDNNDEVWAKMVCSPWQTDEQVANEKIEISNYQSFVSNIFSQKIEDAVRVGLGFHPDWYRTWFFEY